MKKNVIILAFALGLMHANAQTETNASKNYNKWSVEVAGGLSYSQRPMSEGISADIPKSYVADLGVRYMFNNKFGLKADVGYNNFMNNGPAADFGSQYYRADLQGVANLGHIMDFQSFTNTVGLLAHAGFGVGRVVSNKDFMDKTANFIAGVTGQIRLSNRLALTGDFSTIYNALQDHTFDGQSLTGTRGVSGLVFNATAGLQIYLGKNTKHADWIVISPDATDLSALENKLSNLENTISKIPAKEVIVEKQINNTPIVSDKDVVKEMINDKYYSVYFDFNKSTPIENSTAAIDVVLTYLRKNPSASLDIIGHADQVGSAEYNDKLSNARAENVKKILTQAGISSSRLNVVPGGADASIDKNSEEARRLARRVTFKTK
ncbi:flagellar motor protein MotB [Flavobacteriaceae bacterium CRH]|nr:flagellar motor protein MotB [Flavobacteriaceae bacterium CRH]